MIWLLVSLSIILLCFGFVLLRGAPYLPTLSRQVETALDMLDLEPGQTLLELGCGDGKVLIAAANRGLNVVGYELNPLLAGVAWLRTRRYHRKGNGHVTVIWGDFWTKKWPPADGIYTFLLQSFMQKLDTKIVQYSKDSVKTLKLVSFVFQIPDRTAKTEKDGLFYYEYK